MVERSFDRIVDEGRPRLERLWPDMLATGIMGGIGVGFGVLALLVVEHETGSDVLAGLAFSIGFIALRLGHSELFTEGVLVPVTVVAAGGARIRDLFRLWGWTLVGNPLGGWAILGNLLGGMVLTDHLPPAAPQPGPAHGPPGGQPAPPDPRYPVLDDGLSSCARRGYRC